MLYSTYQNDVCRLLAPVVIHVGIVAPSRPGQSEDCDELQSATFLTTFLLFCLCCSPFPRPEQAAATPLLGEVFTIPTRALSWLKEPSSAFTFKTILRHYAKWALTHGK